MKLKNSTTSIKLHDLHFKPFISEEEIKERIEVIGKDISKQFEGKNPLFIAILNGAFVFAADLVRAAKIQSEIIFIRIASYHGTQSSGEVKTVFGLDKDIKDRHVIIIEDIVDSGKTMHYFLNDLKEKAPASITLATLLIKPGALQFPIEPDYIGFEIPTKFVVGYGLDYDGLGRNFKSIYQLEKSKEN